MAEGQLAARRLGITADDLGRDPLTDRVIAELAAVLGSYEALREGLLRGVDQLPLGTSELFLHPSGEGEGIPAERAWEARLLRDPAWWDGLAELGIEPAASW